MTIRFFFIVLYLDIQFRVHERVNQFMQRDALDRAFAFQKHIARTAHGAHQGIAALECDFYAAHNLGHYCKMGGQFARPFASLHYSLSAHVS
jgi:hypothetical protein